MPDDRPVALDEYPVHQVPLSMKHVATGDRNAYDRCIFQVFDHQGRALLILGLGVYPNVGVIDAYATLRVGDTLHAVRASDALDDDTRMAMAVGPLRILVERSLKDFVLSCAADPEDPDGLSYEINWSADFPALWEPHHVQRRGARLTLEGRRFVQAGRCEGWIRVAGRRSGCPRTAGPAPATGVGARAPCPARKAAGSPRSTAPKASTGSGVPSASRTAS